MKITKVPTFKVVIYIGTKHDGSSESLQEYMDNYEKISTACKNYCDSVGLCVSLKTVDFIYTGGCEDGYEIGLINYPRFPSTPTVITNHAISLSKILKSLMKQKRLTIITPNETMMLGELENEN